MLLKPKIVWYDRNCEVRGENSSPAEVVVDRATNWLSEYSVGQRATSLIDSESLPGKKGWCRPERGMLKMLWRDQLRSV
ncbi:hypothetical protein L484_024127 [Morus notabilis]|uniref:Uncharacterized protein n=1 Tax=Morus notabilis TaxID=981085 RepID=W9RLU5_9ROSA|nr:hypothetical protein L484_024127 [Morus notabilis]